MNRYRIEGRLDGAQGGTMLIDRERALVTVRPRGRRKTYTLPLLAVAEMILARVVRYDTIGGAIGLPVRRRKPF